MDKQKATKIVGVAGAAAVGLALIINGQATDGTQVLLNVFDFALNGSQLTGLGVIFASLGSAGLKSR